MLLARTGFAASDLRRGARKHAVSGRNPAPALSLQPRGEAIFEGRGHEHMRVAEFHKARAFGIFHHPPFERHRSELIGLPFAWPHAGLRNMLPWSTRGFRTFREKCIPPN